MNTEELVVVAEYNSYIEAEMAKNILACAGIDSTIENEMMSMLYPYVVRSRLVVDAEKYKEARTLLRIRE